jgi:hypothetical protein
VPADTTTYRYSGDFKRCLRLKPLAQQGVFLLGMLMSLGNLNTYQIKRVLDDGSSIRVFSSCGATYADIFGVEEKEEEEKEQNPAKETQKNLVMVYVGSPKTPFSKYSVTELVEQSVRLWNTIPDTSLETLAEKKLLVLPCPVRNLTADEAALMRTFLSVDGNRIAVFSGTDFTSTNSVLASLNSKLQCIGKRDGYVPFYSNMSGFLPISATTQQLFWTLIKTAGHVVVHPDYWSTAVVKDWHGYGVAYNSITNMVPDTYYKESAPLGPTWTSHLTVTNWYMFSTLIDNSWFTVDDDAWALGYYPASYITWNYNGKNEVDTISWCNLNAAYLPLVYIYRSTPPTTYFRFGAYFNYSETSAIVNARSNSELAYADGEKIIVGAFEPTFLTGITGYSNALLMQHYKTQDFADWMLMYDMTPNKNMFNTKGCFVLDMPYRYSLQGSSPFIPGIQY